jgi:hypothetical protein
MLRYAIALAAPLCLVSASVLAQPQLLGELEASDSKQRIIQVGGESFNIARGVKVTAEGGQIVDPFLLRPGQPIGLSWQDSDTTRTVTHIYVYDRLPQ